MEAVTGPFILGVDDTPLYHHDHAATDRAVRPQDLPEIADETYAAARELVGAARAEGEAIDMVGELSEPVIDRVISSYFAQEAARAGDRELVSRYIFEASRSTRRTSRCCACAPRRP